MEGLSYRKTGFFVEFIRKLLGRLFPSSLNNEYQGALIALYMFLAITGFTLYRSLHHLIAEDGGAQSIATIPLSNFSADAATAVIGIF